MTADPGRAGQLVDVVFHRHPLAIGLVDATRQLDEGIVEGLRGLALAQGILDVPPPQVDRLELLLELMQLRCPLYLGGQQRLQAFQLGTHIGQLAGIVDALGLDLQDGDLVDEFANRNRGKDGIHAKKP